jgi:hypothetical protein
VVRVRRERFDKAPDVPEELSYLPDFPRHHTAATATGHGGSDYFVLLEFAEAVASGEEPFFDVYRGVAMSAVGIQAWRSCLADGAPFAIPNLRDPAVRATLADDHFSPDPHAPAPALVSVRSGR